MAEKEEGAHRKRSAGVSPVVSRPPFWRRRLPHWEPKGAVYFVTFRLADSMPQEKLIALEAACRQVLQRQSMQVRESPVARQHLTQAVARGVEKILDSGAGACYLRIPKIAKLVTEALRYFNGTRYRLHAWCVMPNHVHVVLELLEGAHLAAVVHSWKSYTAKQANRLLRRSGPFWQREYFDRVIRDEERLRRFVQYVLDNPRRAKLKDWPWVGVELD